MKHPPNWIDCRECNGMGGHWGDYPDDAKWFPCDACNGEGGSEWSCPTCNNGIPADYSDCVVCDFIGSLPLLTKEQGEALGKAAADLLWNTVKGEA